MKPLGFRAVGPGSDERMRAERITDIDVIRGVMLVSMALNHGSGLTRLLGRDGPTVMTLSQILPSSSAEIFFLLSGYLLAHVHLSGLRTASDIPYRWLMRRIASLVLWNTVMFLLLLTAMSVAEKPLLMATRFDGIVADPLAGLTRLLLLTGAPYCLDVLQVYVVFLAVTPCFAAVMLASRKAAAMAVALCWVAVQILALLGAVEPEGTIAMDLWAWQALFFGGMLLGSGRLYQPLLDLIELRRWIVWAAAALLAVLVGAVIGEHHVRLFGLREPLWHLHGADRQTLGPVALMSSVALILVLMWVTRHLRVAETRGGRWLAAAGRNSLSTFCVSNLAVYAAGFAWQAWPTRGAYFAMQAATVVAMLGWACLLEARRGRGSAWAFAPARLTALAPWARSA